MQAEKELSEYHQQENQVLTIGVFDGVHLGHKYLLSRLKEIAKEHSAESGVITFKRHPIEIINPKAVFPYIISLDEKISLLRSEGVDNVIALTFDNELASLGASDFVDLLRHFLKIRGLVIGSDFALGRNREGNLESLIQLGEKRGFFVTVIPPLKLDGEIVSSTAIRKALADGDIAKVVKLTGRSYSLKGRVTSGTGLGRKIGYPTANLTIESGWAIPADGVYATFTHINGDVHQSMTSIGLRPTVGGKNRTVETYILDYKGNLYDKEVSIDIVDRLRDEKKFADIDELKVQISKDIKQGIEILSSRNYLIHQNNLR
jgi:riboflavin kinase / FMN adenylyltransferase